MGKNQAVAAIEGRLGRLHIVNAPAMAALLDAVFLGRHDQAHFVATPVRRLQERAVKSRDASGD